MYLFYIKRVLFSIVHFLRTCANSFHSQGLIYNDLKMKSAVFDFHFVGAAICRPPKCVAFSLTFPRPARNIITSYILLFTSYFKFCRPYGNDRKIGAENGKLLRGKTYIKSKFCIITLCSDKTPFTGFIFYTTKPCKSENISVYRVRFIIM